MSDPRTRACDACLGHGMKLYGFDQVPDLCNECGGSGVVLVPELTTSSPPEKPENPQ